VRGVPPFLAPDCPRRHRPLPGSESASRQRACPGRGAGRERRAGSGDGVAESAGPPASPARSSRGRWGGGGGSQSAARRGARAAAPPGKRRALSRCRQAGGIDPWAGWLAAALQPLSRVLRAPRQRGSCTARSEPAVCVARAAGGGGCPFPGSSPGRGGAGAGPAAPSRTLEGPCGPGSPACRTGAPRPASPRQLLCSARQSGRGRFPPPGGGGTARVDSSLWSELGARVAPLTPLSTLAVAHPVWHTPGRGHTLAAFMHGPIIPGRGHRSTHTRNGP
jgi:hypothetical protein